MNSGSELAYPWMSNGANKNPPGLLIVGSDIGFASISGIPLAGRAQRMHERNECVAYAQPEIK